MALAVVFWPPLTVIWYVRHVIGGGRSDRNVMLLGLAGTVLMASGLLLPRWPVQLAAPALVGGFVAYLMGLVRQQRQILALQSNPIQPGELEAESRPTRPPG